MLISSVRALNCFPHHKLKRVPLKDYARPSLDKHRLGELAAQAGVQDAEKFVEETGRDTTIHRQGRIP
jgi:hypothetical protein